MANIDLSQYGIENVKEVVYNPSYELLFEEETKPELTGFEKGVESELGAVDVKTGIFTGRSPKDKYIVKDAQSENTVWWNTPRQVHRQGRTVREHCMVEYPGVSE